MVHAAGIMYSGNVSVSVLEMEKWEVQNYSHPRLGDSVLWHDHNSKCTFREKGTHS